MKIKRKTDGMVFQMGICQIERGSWSYRIVYADGEPVHERCGSDPYCNERECRAAARRFVEVARYDRQYGWVG